ncbi:hypothetical protein [Microbacterium sp. YJN-G]|uniref:hypothetical protein n=1 Tax=Microbacterium sp. YJN-G TaxID=2763257 RepID=UPI001D0C139D|nr:hypothetical protein [Microbacterium sp. YJN-G]
MKTSLAGFAPGNIISDAVFTNNTTMTEAQIQAFFDSKVKTCRGGIDEDGKPIICLKDYRTDSVDRPADSYCKGYTGAKGESAARIIHRVAQSCNINPQVLIVMLQKEQSLVTHTWPSAWRYEKALGQGCPDDAPCDPKYVGFFYQIYGAARQMQLYMEGRYFTWYAPGNTWNVLYHPNRGCGTAPVYMANKATSALYYYTPYQPNAAALRAGYGTGDSCSSYGNRNFYNYFTDWFGSTQYPDGPIVNAGRDIYLITNGTAHHITADVWAQYRAAFGDPVPTSSAHIASLAQGAKATLFLHDQGAGTVAYLDGGKTHRFPTCDLVVAWGGDCQAALTRLDSEDFTQPGAGAEMTARASVAGDARLFLLEGRELVPYESAAALQAWGHETTGFYVATMPAATAARYRALPTRFVPGQFVVATGATRVYLPTADGELHYLPSFDTARSLGLPTSVKRVSAEAVKSNRVTTTLGPFVLCDAKTYFGAGGALHRVDGNYGFTPVALDATTCGRLRIADDTEKVLFVKASADPAVYTPIQGRFSHVANPATLSILNGAGSIRIVSVTSGELSRLPKGEQIRTDIGFVTTPSDGRVYLSDAGRLVYLTSWTIADALGMPRIVVPISDKAAAAMSKEGNVTTLVECYGRLYRGDGGVLRRVSDAGGEMVTILSSANCATLRFG